jgi:DNA polymerase I-like protein with 3'-5' exonuclease and polymerase domains
MTEWRRPDALPDLRRVDLIALDTETKDDRLQAGKGSGWATGETTIKGIAVAHHANGEIHPNYFPISHPDSPNFPPEQVFQWVRDHVAPGGPRIVTMNGGYDWGVLRSEAGIVMPPPERLEEIVALATMIDENRFSYSLDNLCAWQGLPGKNEDELRAIIKARLNIKCGIRKNKPQAYIAQLPAQFVGPYAETDAAQTLALFEKLYPKLNEEGTETAYRLEVAQLPITHEMRQRGIRADATAAERNHILLLQKRDGVLAKLGELVGHPVDMEDINNVKWLAATADRFGIKYPHTPGGQPSFTAGAFGWMHWHPHEFPRLVTRAREFNTAAAGLMHYVLKYITRGRIHAEIHPHRSDDGGTRSFRYSYSDPPLQQMPSHDPEITPLVRSVFLPEEGERWATVDFAQQEFRLLTGRAAEHDLTGARDALERYRNDPNTDFHSLVAEMTGLSRGDAKHATFGKAYGAGITKFAGIIRKSEDEARAIYDRYDRELPFVSELSALCQRQVERDGYLTLIDGARRHYDQWEARGVAWGKGNLAPCDVGTARRRRRDPSHPWFGQKLQRAGAYFAMNAEIQGNGARIAKLWMVACWREGIVPLLMMHDGLELSVSSPDLAERIAQLGCEVAILPVPMRADVKYGRTWADAKHAWADVPAPEPPSTTPVSYQPPPAVSVTQRLSLITPRADDFPLLDDYVDMVAERHAMYLRRQAGQPHPWTNNPILGRWSFTNMYRSLDKHTARLWDQWCRPHADDPDLWFAMVIARLTNRIETWETLGYPVPWNPEHFIAVMASCPKGKAYGSAYVIPAFQGDKRPKYVSQVERIFTPMWDNREQLRPCAGMTVEAFYQGLCTYPGMGNGFLSAQVCADIKPFSALREAPDFLTFVKPGPGSEPGLNYLLGRPVTATWRERDFCLRLAELHALAEPRLQERGLPPCDMQDKQHRVCEFRKFWQFKSGAKQRLKREYKPPGAAKPRTKKKAKPETVEPTPSIAPEIPDYILDDVTAEARRPETAYASSETSTASSSDNGSWSADADDHSSETFEQRDDSGYPHGDRDSGKQVAFYIYCDAGGRFYLGVKRTSTKQFVQYHWTGTQWVKGAPKGPRLPYRLPELIAADRDAWVVIAAGEKDTETAARLGFVATTNPGGEVPGRWTADLNCWFVGRQHVAIMEDHDATGKAHAIEVATMLRGIVPDIRIVTFHDLPKGGDLTDWVTADPSRGYAALLTKIEATAAARIELEEWDAGDLLSGPLPAPRQWLIGGIFCRTFLSGLVAPGDVGKTTLRLTQAIELATGRELLGVRVYARTKVLVLSFEDDRAELHRRLLAICQHHGIAPTELKGWLFCKDLNGGAKLAELDAKGRKRQIGALDGMLRRAIKRTGCSLVVLDPFVKIHALNENDNPDMDFVCSALIKIAQDCGIAVDSPAHTHKGQIQAGDADARRGASAQRDAGRLDYTFTVMSEGEAEQFGINLDERKRYMRLDKAKANIVRAVKARWFRLISVRLNNADSVYVEGDEVQAIERWEPPETWADASPDALNAILDAIAAGLPDGRRYTSYGKAKDREAWLVVRRHCPDKPEAQCREMVRQWLKNGTLYEKAYDDPVARKERSGLFVDNEKRPRY